MGLLELAAGQIGCVASLVVMLEYKGNALLGGWDISR
jgi:hypothetical protein